MCNHIATLKVLNFVKDKACACIRYSVHQHVHVCKPVYVTDRGRTCNVGSV